MTGWFTSGCAYVHDCHSNTPLMYTPTHTCLHVFKVQVQQNDLTNIQRVKQTTQRARLVISRAWQTTGKRAVMKCGCRVKRWDCINEYGHKTSCHREFELVRDRFGQGQKSEPLTYHIEPLLNPYPCRQDGTQRIRGSTKRQLHRLQRKQMVLRNSRNGMLLLHRRPPIADPGATVYRHSRKKEGEKWKLNFFLSSFPLDALQSAVGAAEGRSRSTQLARSSSQRQHLEKQLADITSRSLHKRKALHICMPIRREA